MARRRLAPVWMFFDWKVGVNKNIKAICKSCRKEIKSIVSRLALTCMFTCKTWLINNNNKKKKIQKMSLIL